MATETAGGGCDGGAGLLLPLNCSECQWLHVAGVIVLHSTELDWGCRTQSS